MTIEIMKSNDDSYGENIFNNVLKDMKTLNIDNYHLLRSKLIEEGNKMSDSDYFIIPYLLEMGIKYLETHMLQIFETSVLNRLGHTSNDVIEILTPAYIINLELIKYDLLEYMKKGIGQAIRDYKSDERLTYNNQEYKSVMSKYESLYEDIKTKIKVFNNP